LRLHSGVRAEGVMNCQTQTCACAGGEPKRRPRR
jgi:hypothetical protein